MYFAKNIAAPAHVRVPPAPLPFALPAPLPTVAHLVQTFLRLLLAYTALPGHYGADEEESEMTLGFWYLFQESLWNADYGFDVAEDGDAGNEGEERERDMMPVACAVYTELVSVLRRKVVWPSRTELNSWPRGMSTFSNMLADTDLDTDLKISETSSKRGFPVPRVIVL